MRMRSSLLEKNDGYCTSFTVGSQPAPIHPHFFSSGGVGCLSSVLTRKLLVLFRTWDCLNMRRHSWNEVLRAWCSTIEPSEGQTACQETLLIPGGDVFFLRIRAPAHAPFIIPLPACVRIRMLVRVVSYHTVAYHTVPYLVPSKPFILRFVFSITPDISVSLKHLKPTAVIYVHALQGTQSATKPTNTRIIIGAMLYFTIPCHTMPRHTIPDHVMPSRLLYASYSDQTNCFFISEKSYSDTWRTTKQP